MKWGPVHANKIPDSDLIRDYNRSVNITPDRNKLQKYFCDLSRVCEVEEAVEEWFTRDCFEQVATDSLKNHIRSNLD